MDWGTNHFVASDEERACRIAVTIEAAEIRSQTRIFEPRLFIFVIVILVVLVFITVIFIFIFVLFILLTVVVIILLVIIPRDLDGLSLALVVSTGRNLAFGHFATAVGRAATL